MAENTDNSNRPKPIGHEELSNKWVGAGHLKAGDRLKKADGTLGTVVYVNTLAETRKMYNLEVQSAHTFFVGQNGWLTHNACQNTLSKLSDIAKSSDNQFVQDRANQLSNIFTEFDRIGSPHSTPGGLAGAIERELATGDLVGGVSHLQKGRDAIRAYNRLIKQITNSHSMPSDSKEKFLNILVNEKSKIEKAFK